MRMSCNGCRVLRKGCSESCSIRPCLQWINNPESQANATVFLAKFYGRAGLMNLINAGPDHLRPAIFRSLLYEACGRIVNPIYGSVGLLWSGNWQLCQATVDAVLKGAPILQISSETAANSPVPPLHKAMVSTYDIRHISKDDPAAPPQLVGAASVATSAAAAHDLHKVNKASRNRFKRSAVHSVNNAGGVTAGPPGPEARTGSPEAETACGPLSCQGCDNLDYWRRWYAGEAERSPSHESSASQATEPTSTGGGAVALGAGMRTPRGSDGRENESEASMLTSHGADPGKANGLAAEDSDVELELTLGREPVHHSQSPYSSSSSGDHSRGPSPSRRAIRRSGGELPYRCDHMTIDGWSVGTTRVDLGLYLPA